MSSILRFSISAAIVALFAGNVCAATIGTVTGAADATRSASYYTGTVDVPVTLDGDETSAAVVVEALADTDVRCTVNDSVTESGTLQLNLSNLIPGTTHTLRVTVTGSGDAVATDSSATVTPAAGYTAMCYKPDAGLGADGYPWTNTDKWYVDTAGTTPTGYVPSLGDDVLLYSSKNNVAGSGSAMTVDAGVHAETLDLMFGISGTGIDGYIIGLTVKNGGSMTNAAHVYMGKRLNGMTGGFITIEDGGTWYTAGSFLVGQYSGMNTLLVNAGGTFGCGGEFIVGNGAATNTQMAPSGVVTNAGTMNVYDFFVGSQNGASGQVEVSGTLNIGRKFTLGRNETAGASYTHLTKDATLTFGDAGTPIYVAYRADATLEVDCEMGLAGTSTSLQFGNASGKTGTLILNESVRIPMCGDIRLGASQGGRGVLTLNGSSEIASPNYLYLGYETDSYGKLTLNDSSAITNVRKRIVVGYAQDAYGEIEVGTNAFIGNTVTNLSLGQEEGAFGLLRMRGGRVEMPGVSSGYRLYVGSSPDEPRGAVRGWGFVGKGATDGSNLRMMMYGQVTADGEGENRDLDLARFRTVGLLAEKTLASVNACGTNGWYALNKGRLLLPASQPISSSGYNTVGAYPTAGTALFVNSFVFAASGLTYGSGTYVHAMLYAPDRNDIPAGLPLAEGDRVMNVMRAGFFSTANEGLPSAADKMSYTTASISSYRYQAEGVADVHRVRVYRHDGTSWKLVAVKKHFAAEDPLISTDSFTPAADDYNLGWFAFVDCPNLTGLTISIR